MIRKTNPLGIDVIIDKMQVYFDKKLLLTFPDWENNHRAYKNPLKNGLIPEVYTANGEYREVFFNDNFVMTSFFLVGDERSYRDGLSTVKISLIVQTNLSLALQDISHRADEELISTFSDVIKQSIWAKNFANTITGIDNVYSEFDKSKIKYDDMSNFHVVRFDFVDVSYDASLKCCTDC